MGESDRVRHRCPVVKRYSLRECYPSRNQKADIRRQEALLGLAVQPAAEGEQGIRGKAAHAILNNPVHCAPFIERQDRQSLTHYKKVFANFLAEIFSYYIESPHPLTPSPRGEGVAKPWATA